MGRIMMAICGWTALVGIAAMVLPIPSANPATDSAPKDFATLCAPCHGADGKGDGPLASKLAKAPADLTVLSARNGGHFPMAVLMHRIWSYAEGGVVGAHMPDLGPVLDSTPVMFDEGNGIATPTPQRLVDLAKYIAGFQG